ncbi:MAG: response regulator transcription factor [Gemmatimonadota bacterium]
MARLLVIEDDRMFATLISRALREEGHVTDVIGEYAEGRMLAFVHDYDGILIDVGLPGGSGLSIAQELRKEGRMTPIMMLTANDSASDIIRGLDTGADDYLTKPFEIDVFKARVRALVRRTGVRTVESLAIGGVVVERGTYRVTINGRKVAFTPKEFALLAYLIQRADQVVTRSELLEKVWDLTFDPGSNVVDVHVARLRAKLREHGALPKLLTVRGAGFMLTLGDDAAG